MAPVTSAVLTRSVRIGQRQGTDRRHELGAVQQGESFLGLQLHRLQTGGGQGLRAGEHGARHVRLALADDDQGQVGKRREVPGGAHASA